MQKLGWLIVGHGTRDPEGRAEFLRVAELLSDRTSAAVEPCFLELAEPTIAEGLSRLASRGVRRVIVVPLLLFSAGHAKDDVPLAVAEAAQPLGIQVIGQAGALDDHPQLLELSRLLIRRVGFQPAAQLLFVSRGGSDPLAIAAAEDYGRQLAHSMNMLGETAFVAIAKPSLAEMLEQIAARDPQQVIVVPHLLFQGEVLATITAAVQSVAEQHVKTRWMIAPHLGPHELLIEAVLARMNEVK